MQPKEVRISDELRDKLSECLKPYADACDPVMFMDQSDVESLFSVRHDLNRVVSVIAKDLSGVFNSTEDGGKILDDIADIYKSSGDSKDKPAILYSNMPTGGEGAYLLLGLRNIMGAKFNGMRSHIIQSPGKFDDYMHQDSSSTKSFRLLIIHGYLNENRNIPTVFANKQDIVKEVLKYIESNNNNDARVTKEDVLIFLKNNPSLDDLGGYKSFEAMSLDESEKNHKISEAINSIKHTPNMFDKVILQPDNMIVFNNQELWHARGDELLNSRGEIEHKAKRELFRVCVPEKNINEVIQELKFHKGQPTSDIDTQYAAIAKLQEISYELDDSRQPTL